MNEAIKSNRASQDVGAPQHSNVSTTAQRHHTARTISLAPQEIDVPQTALTRDCRVQGCPSVLSRASTVPDQVSQECPSVLSGAPTVSAREVAHATCPTQSGAKCPTQREAMPASNSTPLPSIYEESKTEQNGQDDQHISTDRSREPSESLLMMAAMPKPGVGDSIRAGILEVEAIIHEEFTRDGASADASDDASDRGPPPFADDSDDDDSGPPPLVDHDWRPDVGDTDSAPDAGDT